jgi:short-subunit dehydrogenase
MSTPLIAPKAALVTGASSGIGEAFARALAERSVDLLLTSLPADEARLRDVAEELSSRHQVRTEIVAVDLSASDGPLRLQQAADELHFEPDTLVNSAGYGVVGRFGDAPLDEQLAMIRVNAEALVALAGLYLPRMVSRGAGSIINVASTVGLSPVPYLAVYAATKAFVLSFSNALWAEYRRSGVRVVAVCPGPTVTRFHERLAREAPPVALDPAGVVKAAFDALERDRPAIVRRVMPFGVVFALLSAPVTPRRLRLIASEKLAGWFFSQSM